MHIAQGVRRFRSSKCVLIVSKLLKMRFSLFYAALYAPSALAFPWMTPEGMGNLLNHPEARQEINRRLKELDRRGPEQSQSHASRQLGTGLLDGVGTLLDGTLGAILDNVLGLIPTPESVNGLKKFPEGISHHITSMILTLIACYLLCIDLTFSRLPISTTRPY